MNRLTLAIVPTLAALTAPVHAQWAVTNLHPFGSTSSGAIGAFDTQQVGIAVFNDVPRACLWRGTTSSRVDLHPAGSTYSIALNTSGTQQVGYATIGGQDHAGLWSGTAASWVDLKPAGTTSSHVTGTSGTQQVGYAVVGGIFHAGLFELTLSSLRDVEVFLTPCLKAKRVGGKNGKLSPLKVISGH